MVDVEEKRLYCAYYTKSDPIVRYMVGKLELRPNMRVLEPAAGDGVFVDALLDEEHMEIDAYELNPKAVTQLGKKYRGNTHVKIYSSDTLLDSSLDLSANTGGSYDLIIANPPYGAWQELEKRKALKKAYPGLYVKETYALFLYRCVTLLKAGGQLAFIVPDTYLNLHRHTALRKYLLTHTKIREIALFPSSFFPGVNFGYANLCIISLVKHKNVDESLANEFNVMRGFRKIDELTATNSNFNATANYNRNQFTQEHIYKNPDHALYVTEDPKVSAILTDADTRLETIADCVTGFYSGDDKAYVRELPEVAKAKYEAISSDDVSTNYLNSEKLLEGLTEKPYFLPMMKGGNIGFYKPTSYYINWSRKAVAHYKKDRKARFQNAQYYFRQGIGIPMVSSSKISAALIDERLFDQGIVGVFPKDAKYLYYLLAFFNSSTCNQLIRTINPSANNSANYLKKLPVLIPSESLLKRINNLVHNILEKRHDCFASTQNEEKSLEALIGEFYGF